LTPPLAWLCDFDGTIAPSDVGARFVRRFSTGGAARHAALEARWRAGELGHRALTEAECEVLVCDAAQAQAFVSDFVIDPGFAGFARAALGRGEAVCVVSEGFDFYIRELLDRAGVPPLPVASNRVRFEGGRVIPEFPHAARSCGRCGNCKAAHVAEWSARGYRTVLVGDGFSDRCAARVADRVLARGSLLEWCAAEGIAARPALNFAEVDALAAELAGATGARGVA
jgi:2-hydroxy-3-keto-5-methylthiopentenyl-1-phosphate phosphatase